jgi:hypothetical protein
VARKNNKTRPRVLDVVAEGELRVEPDWDKFAWALLQFVKLQREQAERESKLTKSESSK